MNWTKFESSAKARDRKLRRRRSADMVVSNRNLKSVILPTIARKAAVAKRTKEESERVIAQRYAEEHDPDDGYGTSY